VAPGPVTTSVELTAAPESPVTGQHVHLTVTLTPSAATGDVTFLDNGSEIGTAGVVGGTASVDVPFASSGDHALTAVFTPEDETAFTASTSPVLPLTMAEPPADQAVISLSDTEVQAGESLTAVTAARDGSLSAVVTVPTATGQTSGLTASAALVVSTTSIGGSGNDGGTVSTDPSSLTSTGAHGILWLVAGAVVLLAAGTATLVVRRRRGGSQTR